MCRGTDDYLLAKLARILATPAERGHLLSGEFCRLAPLTKGRSRLDDDLNLVTSGPAWGESAATLLPAPGRYAFGQQVESGGNRETLPWRLDQGRGSTG
jgi:hypothetical protein